MSEEQPKKGFFQIEKNQIYNEASSTALSGLFFYSILMFTVPLLVFFFSRPYLEYLFNLEPPYSQLAPAILAVIAVNLIMVAYVIKAIKENAKEQPLDAKTLEERKKKE